MSQQKYSEDYIHFASHCGIIDGCIVSCLLWTFLIIKCTLIYSGFANYGEMGDKLLEKFLLTQPGKTVKFTESIIVLHVYAKYTLHVTSLTNSLLICTDFAIQQNG